ncbi:retrovirus-related pol polyprotein from transposon TNT 1-94 [Tanacetum coccineum]|uniref:Retrovirus-related pol polyprotein from transposon TNT 1-94 n=1 Tax=Tanacetum coccineum TaxID=301880 RepID=A0ABQ5BNE8_9ASTR
MMKELVIRNLVSDIFAYAAHNRSLCFNRRENCFSCMYAQKKVVYVCQLKGFIDADHPSQNHFFKGTIDPTLFIRRFDDGTSSEYSYVDDIIFGSTHPRYTQLFSDLMKSRFEMSMMGEMTFFLGLQVNQSPRGIFINQSNYVLEILKKYGMEACDPVGTPMEIKDKLDLDQNGSPVDATKYRSMIGALMYLTSSRPDIVHATCLCARYQAKPTEKHLKEVKRIFRYLRGTVNTGLWYSKDSGEKLVSWSSKKQDVLRCLRGSRICVSIRLMCPSPLDADTVNGLWLSLHKIPTTEHVEKGTIELYFVKTDYQLADLFTKALPVDRFNYLVRRLGMRSLSPKELERLAKSRWKSFLSQQQTTLGRWPCEIHRIKTYWLCQLKETMDHKGAKDCCQLGLREKRCGASLNECPRPLFIAFPTLRGQEILVIRLGHMGDDVESLGAVLERLWCKVEVDGGGFGSCGVRG